jgi:hypothetical protein
MQDIRAERPMPLAEADQCCGAVQWIEVEDHWSIDVCPNCPLLIERKREDVMRAARAM